MRKDGEKNFKDLTERKGWRGDVGNGSRERLIAFLLNKKAAGSGKNEVRVDRLYYLFLTCRKSLQIGHEVLIKLSQFFSLGMHTVNASFSSTSKQ